MKIYRLLSIYHDGKAIAKGRFPQRVVRKQIYKGAFRLAGWVARKLGVSK